MWYRMNIFKFLFADDIQILMSVNSTMEDVITIVLILMVATTVHVMMDTFWKRITPVVLVCVRDNEIENILNCYVF